MNSRTFNAWLRYWGYHWVQDEQLVKGFMTEVEALNTLQDYESRGMVRRG